MPLYEYQCEKCGRFETIQKFSDEPVKACPTCGGPVQKLLSSPAIQFKGTGWYVTDYAKSGSGSKGKSEGGKDGGGKDSGSKDSGSKDSGSKDAPAAKSGSGSGGGKSET